MNEKEVVRMNKNSNREQGVGMLFAGLSYVLWGFLPLYWKLVDDIPAAEVLAHRVVWSLVFMFIILLLVGKFTSFWAELKALLTNRKRLVAISFASVFISINWGLYIWAVASEQLVQASLGYYINPLVSILLGIIVLKEKLSTLQTISFIIAAVGVLNLAFNFGEFPWLALLLAFSFGIYGLLKKMVQLGALVGLAIETLLITPFALLFLVFMPWDDAFGTSGGTTLLLIVAGIATAVPLLLFASGAKRIPLSLVGLLQYIAPTITLILGVFLFNEPFTGVHLFSFICIWAALTLYTLSISKWFKVQPVKKTLQG